MVKKECDKNESGQCRFSTKVSQLPGLCILGTFPLGHGGNEQDEILIFQGLNKGNGKQCPSVSLYMGDSS